MTNSNVAAQSIALNARVSLTERGGTLGDLLAQQKRLAFSKVVDYLDQLSEAIDLAHEQGFIHRSLNPFTILLTDEGHLVILGLRSTGGRKHSRETRGTTYEDSRLMRVAYMAPEQILTGSILSSAARHLSNIPGIERTVDGRADLYSLGVILYQMVTGVLPFQAETLEQMALMHLRMPPPSPRQLRPDLPPAAEQAMLRALAKRPADRYLRAQDLATALSVALIAAGQLDAYPYAGSESFSEEELTISSHIPSFGMTTQKPHDEDLDKDQPTNPIPVVNLAPSSSTDSAITPFSPTTPEPASTVPAPSVVASAERSGASINPSSPSPIDRPPTSPEAIPTSTSAQPAPLPAGYNPTSPLPVTGTTGALSLSNPQQGNTGTLKLTGPAKIVQVPVAGQPGLYVTGLLPIFPQQPTPGATATATSPEDNSTRGTNVGAPITASVFAPIARLSAKARTILTLALVVMLVVCASGLIWFIHAHSSQSITPGTLTGTPNVNATATAHAAATVNTNVILIDPLSANIHNWPIATTGSIIYVFENGAYHITDNNPKQGAPAILPDETLNGSFAYTLTMEEIKGDDTSINNEFGMIVRANSQNQHGKIVTTFYSFEVLNTKNGEYQFWKYDSNSGPWTKLWHHPFGKEFHQGHGSKSINTFKIFVNGKNFTLIVNGKQIATVSDTSCKGCPCTCSGGIGMWVNLKGTEVAFSNLQLTHQ